jgi:hypothetical protein
MSANYTNQVDSVHTTTLPNLEIHVPNGQSAVVNTDPASNPTVHAKGASNSASKAVQVTVSGVKFSNPS